ncbi:hypothetical protein AAMO2058_000895700 [Amorphochlora amoebiformis]
MAVRNLSPLPVLAVAASVALLVFFFQQPYSATLKSSVSRASRTMPTVVGMRASGISPICPQNSLGRVFMGQKLGPRKDTTQRMTMSATVANEESKEVGLARVGPNTLIQTVGALKDRYGNEEAADLLKRAGFEYLADDLPTSMVQEMNFHNLLKGLKPQIGDEELSQILFAAGSGTAQYLLKVRIPGFFQELVKILPRKPALQLLLFAIGKAGAWTFRGSGEYYTVDTANGVDIHVSVKYPSLPLVSNFYRGVFDYLIHTLVDKDMPVVPDTSIKGDLIDCNIMCKLEY